MRQFENIVIFGGSGFIGTHLRRHLEDRQKTGVYNADIVIHENDATSRTVDIRHPFDIEGNFGPNTLIFNLAAIHTTPGHPDKAYFETNIRGAENVCAFARKHGIANIVFTSSISPYGAAEVLKTEESLPTPTSPYGISKLVAEKIHQIWLAESSAHALSIVRPGIVFGQGENGNMTRLYKGLKGHKFAYPGRKDTVKAAIYVKDLVRVMMEMAQNENNRFQLYNCCFYPSHNIEEIATTMLRVIGMRRTIPFLPKTPLKLAAKAGGLLGGFGLGICPERVQKLMMSTNVCGKKIAQDYPLRYGLEAAFADWWKDCGGKELV